MPTPTVMFLVKHLSWMHSLLSIFTYTELYNSNLACSKLDFLPQKQQNPTHTHTVQLLLVFFWSFCSSHQTSHTRLLIYLASSWLFLHWNPEVEHLHSLPLQLSFSFENVLFFLLLLVFIKFYFKMLKKYYIFILGYSWFNRNCWEQDCGEVKVRVYVFIYGLRIFIILEFRESLIGIII